MTKKLTLSIDDTVIEKAKAYAKLNNVSISQLVEAHLTEVTQNDEPELTGVVAELAGIIPDTPFDKIEYLEQKFSWHTPLSTATLSSI